MVYRRCGNSGIVLPAVSLGFWHNFGEAANYENCRNMVTTAFDLGINHFDLANNYGPPPGSAETMFGRILRNELSAYRDEMLITSKAGYGMWSGPYQDGGSKKYLVSSLDCSLKRMGLEYVDIFYHHRFDPNTPLEETMDALAGIVRSGKALYAGISNYSPEQARRAVELLDKQGIHCLVCQPCYNMLNRAPEEGLFDALEECGVGSVAFSPLAQGLLTDRYLNGVPADSRAGGSSIFLNADSVTDKKIALVRRLAAVAEKRGQTVAQLALSWVLRGPLTSVIIGASRPSQIVDSVGAIKNLTFTEQELDEIDAALAEARD